LTGRDDHGIGDVRGRESDNPGAAHRARGEHASVSNQVSPGWRQDAGEAP
jgi:hypothetical protein